MPITGRAPWVAGLVALSVVIVQSVSCGGAGGGPTARVMPTSPAPPVTVTAPPEGDPAVTVINVVQACREKDGGRLRSFVAATVAEQELASMFARGSDVRLVSQAPAKAEGARAAVAVRLEVRRDGEMEAVERTWHLERGTDGVWRLTALPDCF